MQRMLFLVVSKRVCQIWLPVGMGWRMFCEAGQLLYASGIEISPLFLSLNLPNYILSRSRRVDLSRLLLSPLTWHEQPIKLVAQIYRAMCEVSSRAILLTKQVISIAIERGIACG